jgi:hypothetical protein
MLERLGLERLLHSIHAAEVFDDRRQQSLIFIQMQMHMYHLLQQIFL